MLTRVDPQLQDATLAEWRGSRAKVIRYQVEGKKMVLMLYDSGDPELLLIVAVGCKNISGTLSWKNSAVAFIVESLPVGEEDGKCLILDCDAEFSLLASSVDVYRIPAVEFDTIDSFMQKI